MLREYLKPELIEDPKIRLILDKYSDRILKIINQDVISYEDFKRLVKVIFKKSEKGPKEGSYTYERELQQLYDEYKLFKRFFSNKKRAEKLIEALGKISNEKSIHYEDVSDLK